MTKAFGNRVRLGFLSFALIFTATAIVQYYFTTRQLRRVVTSQLQSWGEELRDSVVGDGRWQLPAFRQSAPAAPDYFIVSRAGLLVEVDGFVPGLLPRVSPPTWPTDGKPHRVRSPLDEDWLLLGHTVRGGLAVLGVQRVRDLPDAEERLRTNAARFGSDLGEALQVTPRRIDPNIDYAVIDDHGEVRTMWGGVPLQTDADAITRTLAAGPLVHLGEVAYHLYAQPLPEGTGPPLGTAVLFKNVSGEEAMRRQALAFNIAVGAISWVAVVSLFLYYARSFRGPDISCEQAYTSDEGQKVEFKSSFRWDYKLGKTSKDIEAAVIKTVAAFLNSEGGVLLVGVDDNKVVLGLEPDYQSLKTKPNRDGWTLGLQQAFTQAFGVDLSARNVHIGFCALEGKDVCIVTVKPSRRAVFVEEAVSDSRGQFSRREMFYVRLGNATRALDVREALSYAGAHWGT